MQKHAGREERGQERRGGEEERLARVEVRRSG